MIIHDKIQEDISSWMLDQILLIYISIPPTDDFYYTFRRQHATQPEPQGGTNVGYCISSGVYGGIIEFNSK